jgi:hypothetical protein
MFPPAALGLKRSELRRFPSFESGPTQTLRKHTNTFPPALEGSLLVAEVAVRSSDIEDVTMVNGC